MNWYIKVLQNYANFEGRAARTEFWMFVLFNALISIGLAVIDGLTGLVIPIGDGGAGVGILRTIYFFAVLIPFLAVAARRLHDTDKSGLWLLLIPTICGGLVLLLFYVQEGTSGSNKFGFDPLGRGKSKRLREEEYEDESYEDDPEDRPRGGRGRVRDEDDEDDRPPQGRPRPRRDDR